MNIKRNQGYKFFVSIILILCSFIGGVYAQDTIKEITAKIRPDINIYVEGKKAEMKDNQSNTIYPISYNNTTYIPIRAISNIFGRDIEWDNVTQTIYVGEYGINIKDYPEVKESDILINPESGSKNTEQNLIYYVNELKFPLILNKNDELGNHDMIKDIYFSTYTNKEGKLQYLLNIRHNNGKLIKHPHFYAIDPNTDVYTLDSYINTINIYLIDGTFTYKMPEYDNYTSTDEGIEKFTSSDEYTKVASDVLFYIGLEKGSFPLDTSEKDIYPEDIDKIVFKYSNGHSFMIDPKEIRIESSEANQYDTSQAGSLIYDSKKFEKIIKTNEFENENNNQENAGEKYCLNNIIGSFNNFNSNTSKYTAKLPDNKNIS